jgi:hypothetical protein
MVKSGLLLLLGPSADAEDETSVAVPPAPLLSRSEPKLFLVMEDVLLCEAPPSGRCSEGEPVFSNNKLLSSIWLSGLRCGANTTRVYHR